MKQKLDKLAAKKRQEKAAKESLQEEALAEVEEKPPLPPPSEAPPVEGPPEPLKLWLPEEGIWRITSEEHGSSVFGKQGDQKNASEDKVQVLWYEGSKNKIKSAWVRTCGLVKLSKEEQAKHFKRKQLSLSRAWKQELLQVMGALKVDPSGDEEAESVEQVPADKMPPGGLRDQHLRMAWELVKWQVQVLEGCHYLDPLLVHFYLLHVEHEQDPEAEKVLKALQREVGGKKRLLVPIGNEVHWTLLVIDQDEGGIRVRYYDSLEPLSQTCKSISELLLRCVWPDWEGEGLVRKNERSRQEASGNKCGLFVAAWMEAEAAQFAGFGEAATGWPAEAAVVWHERLHKAAGQLKKEKEKREKELRDHEAKMKADGDLRRLEREKLAEKGRKKQESEEELNELEKEALALLGKGKGFGPEDLSEESKKKLQRIEEEGHIGVCSRCRWRSGCLDCHTEKALRYLLKKEALRAGRKVAEEYV